MATDVFDVCVTGPRRVIERLFAGLVAGLESRRAKLPANQAALLQGLREPVWTQAGAVIRFEFAQGVAIQEYLVAVARMQGLVAEVKAVEARACEPPYERWVDKVVRAIAEREGFQKIRFDLNVDNTACLLVRDGNGFLYTDALSAELIGRYRHNVDGLAEYIVRKVRAAFRESLRQFRGWFGDSTIVDGNGNPLVVYHTTKADFARFEKTEDIGFHFGTVEQAMARAEKRGNDKMLAVYLSIRNPLEMPDLGDWDFWRFTEDGMPNAFYEKGGGELGVAFTGSDIEYVAEHLAGQPNNAAGWEWLRNYFESKGFDGIKYQNVGETENEEAGDYSYIAFRPDQIRVVSGTSLALAPKLNEPVVCNKRADATPRP